jgi:molybdate transport system regulatory protein
MNRSAQISPRWRVYLGTEIALGPGKVQLLKAIAESGSLLLAAQRIGISYMRAWKLVKTMNRCFKQPAVVLTRGGTTGGSTTLTDCGKAMIEP